MRHVSTTLDPPAATLRGGPVLTAHLLGRFTVVVDDRAVDTQSSRRTRNVLAYLLSHRRARTARDVLMEAFWPDARPAAARNSLHVTLTGARNALRACSPEPILQRQFDTYGICDSAEVWVDVEEFERHCHAGLRAERAGDTSAALASYEQAGQLYAGEFFADEPYSEWAAPIRAGLEILAVDGQSRLVDLYAARGDHYAALRLGRWILTVDPCNEVVHRRLMASYAAIGQGHLALTQYHHCAESLWESFRMPPAPETRALNARLRDLAAGLRRTA